MSFIPLKVFRRDSDATLGADGDSQSLYNNAVGRLKVSQWPGAFTPTTGNITTSSTVVGPVDVSRAGSATVSVSGTYAGVNFLFELSNDNGTSWSAISAQRVDTGAFETTTGVIASVSRVWDITPILGAGLFRVRATAFTSGSAVITIVPSATAIENMVQLVSGSASLGTVGINAGQQITTVPTATATGLSTYFNASLGATLTQVKGSSGRVHKFYVENTSATKVYLQLFDTAIGSITLGTTAPKQSYAIPANGIFEDFFTYADSHFTAIIIAVTTTVNGNTAPATGAVVNLGYI